MRDLWRWVTGSVLASLLLVACSGKPSAAGGTPKVDLDADPLALLPPGAMVVGVLDARAALQSASLGATLQHAADALLPFGDDAGLRASRDVDRVAFASYAAAGRPDIAAILTGRFDPDKIAAAPRTRSGAVIARSVYAGFATSAVGSVVVAALTPRTLVAGTPAGVWAVLDRVRRGEIASSLSPVTLETLKTPSAQAAVVADLSSQPIAGASLGAIRLDWLHGLRLLRVVGDFNAPGLNVAATLSYGDPQQAAGAADAIRATEGMIALLGPVLGGAKIHDFQAGVAGGDVTCKFAVDDASLGSLATLAARLLPPS